MIPYSDIFADPACMWEEKLQNMPESVNRKWQFSLWNILIINFEICAHSALNLSLDKSYLLDRELESDYLWTFLEKLLSKRSYRLYITLLDTITDYYHYFLFVQWALNVLKKPIVTIQWLYQCWSEHRVVPQESYRVLPFSGLAICVTRIPAGYYVNYVFTLLVTDYLVIEY